MKKKDLSKMLKSMESYVHETVCVEFVEIDDGVIDRGKSTGVLKKYRAFDKKVKVEDQFGLEHGIPFFGRACMITEIRAENGYVLYAQNMDIPQATTESRWREMLNTRIRILGKRAEEEFLLPSA